MRKIFMLTMLFSHTFLCNFVWAENQVVRGVSYSETRCIDFLNLSDDNCFIGMNPNNTDGSGNSGFTFGKIDKGFASIDSRHTIHYDLEERDSRTNNQLRTIPEGEMASVRLGNWNTGGEAERIEYKYTVDVSSSAVLILKYALVLQDSGHASINNPHFTLEILSKNYKLLDSYCLSVDFTVDYNAGNWNFNNDGTCWKDWTTIGFSLREYDGEEVIVRLTTYDCADKGHFGYAYFTLDCSDGWVKDYWDDNGNCVFEGPEGFLYRWYFENHPDETISTNRSLIVSAQDTTTYCLDVISLNSSDCYYTIKTIKVSNRYVYVYVSTPDENKGVVVGGGVYSLGDTAMIIAKANDGYAFDYWSSGGNYYYEDTLKFEVYKCEWFTAHFKSILMVDSIYYHLDKKNNLAEVACNENYTGNIVIPAQILYDGVNYNVTTIEDGAFMNTKIASLNLPNSIISIGNRAFSGCQSLTSIIIQAENPPTIDEYTFENVPRSISIKVPCGSIAKYKAADGWNEFTNYEEILSKLTVDVNDKTMGFATITKQNNCTDDVAQVQAQALAGYEFVRWSDGATENPHILLVTEDMTITAEFRKIGEEPEGKPGEEENHNSFIVESADKTQGTVEIIITAKAIEGFEFDHWSDGSTENPRIVTLDEDVELYAYFRVAGTGLENLVISSASVYGNNGVLYVEGVETDYHVLDASGRLIYTGRDAQLQLPRGVYMVAIGGEVQKVVL